MLSNVGLLPAERAAFFSLSQSAALYGARKTAEGVWRSNAYPTVEHADGSTEAAVFAGACRINHACAPNAHVAWSKALTQQTVHAVRQIAAGDEVTVSYAVPGAARAARQTHLHGKFGFACACPLCVLTGVELEASDARQTRLGELATLLDGRGYRRDARGEDRAPTVALVTEKLRLLAAEGLPREWAHMDMVSAFTACCQRGDFAAARPWMCRAIAAARTMLGSDSKVVHDLEQILRQR